MIFIYKELYSNEEACWFLRTEPKKPNRLIPPTTPVLWNLPARTETSEIRPLIFFSELSRFPSPILFLFFSFQAKQELPLMTVIMFNRWADYLLLLERKQPLRCSRNLLRIYTWVILKLSTSGFEKKSFKMNCFWSFL